MSNNSETKKALNELLQGEYMAVDSFNNFISRLEDENAIECLKEVQKQHRENIDKLASYIQDIGGQPDENIGMKGKMGEMMLNMELGSETDMSEIIEKAIEGETKGVNMAEKVLRGALDDRSRNIAGVILEEDRKSIEKLKSLFKNIEEPN
ncbi:MAG TPA: DUF2383 domain-containing protein [Tissierellales bacterium]|nr:DUF2383 domain-containing protein [Tissierellales bacterium]